MQNKRIILNRITAGFTIGIYLIQLWYSTAWLLATRNVLGYSTLQTSSLWSLNSLKGLIVFVFPFVLNEAAVWLVIAGLFWSWNDLKIYIRISAIFWVSTVSLRVLGYVLNSVFLEKVTLGFFQIGTSPLWLVTFLVFFWLQKNRKKLV